MYERAGCSIFASKQYMGKRWRIYGYMDEIRLAVS